MRLDARRGDRHWHVWHCRLMREVEFVVWVDDETVQTCRYAAAFISNKWRPVPPTMVEQHSTVRIVPEARLVLIDEVCEGDSQSLSTKENPSKNIATEKL